MRVVIVDDEALARRWIREHLAPEKDVQVIGEASDGTEAIRLIEEQKPDLVFLDVEMPGPNGIELLQRLNHDPYVIFTTAFDRYAVTAFELHALDYLLKPFTQARLAEALRRAREQLPDPAPPASERAQAMGRSPLDRLFVRTRGRILPIETSAIVRLEAERDYVAVHSGGKAHLLTTSLTRLMSQLDNSVFVRVHRSHAVNLRRIVEMTPASNGRLDIVLDTGDVVTASRTYAGQLRDLVY